MASLDEFLAAERQQESGGNYKIVNSIGAAGAYQIMGYHIPDWSKAALGHSISEAEFLSHPEEQDTIARYEFAPIYAKYGPRGAAAWWYSGNASLANDYRPQKNGPSIGTYVDDVMALIGKAGSVTGGSGGSTATQTDNVSGSAVHTAGLQQGGYEAVINLTPWGIPLNPFKLPGWLGGKLGDLGNAAGGAISGAETAMWDALAPIVMASIGVLAGAGIVIVGLYVTAKPTVDKAADKAAEAAQEVTQVAATAAPMAAAA